MRAKSFICALPIAACLMCSAFAAEQVTTNPAAAGDGVQVGVAKRDGITISGAEAYVTRNGATEKMTKDLVLPSGVTIKPDGTIISRTGVQATLKPTQLMTMDGVVVEIPPDPNVNPSLPPTQTRTTTQQRTMTNGSGQFSAVEGGQLPSGSRNDRGSGGGGGSLYFDGGGAGVGGASLDGNGFVNGQTVFVGRDGVPFIGTVNADGSITTSNGQTVANDGSLRTINYDGRGNPTLGTVNRTGTVTRSDGSTVSPDGTVRASDGTVISQRSGNQNTTNSGTTTNNSTAARNANNAAAVNDANAVLDGNGNSNPQTVQPNGTPQPVANNGVASESPSTTTNSPNNTGTVNVGSRSANGNSPNNTGTVNSGTSTNNNNTGTINNNPASANSPTGVSRSGTQTTTGNSNVSNRGTTGGTTRGARATNGGSSSGSGANSGASGAGGASGGAAGGASR